MKKNTNFAIKLLLSLLVLFSFSTIVKADAANYQFLIITPEKYETIARQFIALHNGTGAGGIMAPGNPGEKWQIRGAYAVLEEIVARYDGQTADDSPEPSPAPAPPVPAVPTLIGAGFDYPPELNPLPNLCVIKFLRGVLQFPEEHQLTNFRVDYEYAFDVLCDENGDSGVIQPEQADFSYLLILGDTGAAGGGSMTFNGVPESWYVWLNEDIYNQEPDADGSVFPTDFFYAAPNYYDGLNWIPSLRVGRIPIHDLNPPEESGNITELASIGIDDAAYIPGYNDIVECDVCDSYHGALLPWADGQWARHELWIVSDGNPPPEGQAAPIGATYFIIDNTDTCLRVVGDPSASGAEIEQTGPPFITGDGYEIHDTGLDEAQAIYTKCEDYAVEVVTNPSATWNTWFNKVVTSSGNSSPSLFAFWDEFLHAYITNQGSFEGNELIKLRHTNKDDGVVGNDFDVASVSPYLNDSDCGLLFLLGGDTVVDALELDVGNITDTDLFTYTSTDNHIPIMVSNTNYHGRFDYRDASGVVEPSFGAAAVETIGAGTTGGAIAFIGSTSSTYQGIIPYFSNGVLNQARLYNFDELLSYTMQAFHSSPRFLGDMFLGSPSPVNPEEGLPFHQFLANNLEDVAEDGGLSFWASQKTIWTYTLFGDPVMPIPYPSDTPIDTGTSAPTLAFNETTLRNRVPRYESHDIGVDEIPNGVGGSTTTTVNITPVKPLAYPAVPQVRITRVDVMRDTGIHYPAPAAPANYTFTTLNTVPGYYFVKVEQPGYDLGAGAWESWFEKERWMYVQEVNQFTPANDILVVDDDFGYPIVTRYSVPQEIFVSFAANNPRGYEDWYLKSLDDLGQSYDIWHVSYDDNYILYPGGDDNWSGIDSSDALMNGEVYETLLEQYEKVIWLTGDPSGYWRPADNNSIPSQLYPERATWLIETLTGAEQTRLKDYLDSEGRLLLSGQGILDDLGCSGIREADATVPGARNIWCERRSGEGNIGIQNEFLTNYLHLTDLHSSYQFGYVTYLNRVANNPVVDNALTIDIHGPQGAENQYFFVDAEPNIDTPIVSRIFQYDFSSGGQPPHIADPAFPFIGTGGTAYYRGLGAHVFLPWGFEAIDNQTNRNEVLAAILSWLDAPTRTGAGEDLPPGPGGEEEGGGGVGKLSGCFIATACYGTPMSEEVRALSQFRDNYLLSNSCGKFFVGNYYRFSPYVAEYISQRPMLKKFVRMGLKPLVSLCEKFVVEK